jgi:hypothetical protein
LEQLQEELDQGNLQPVKMDSLVDEIVDYLHDPFAENHMNIADCDRWIEES